MPTVVWWSDRLAKQIRRGIRFLEGLPRLLTNTPFSRALLRLLPDHTQPPSACSFSSTTQSCLLGPGAAFLPPHGGPSTPPLQTPSQGSLPDSSLWDRSGVSRLHRMGRWGVGFSCPLPAFLKTFALWPATVRRAEQWPVSSGPESFQGDLVPPSSSEAVSGKVGCAELPLTTSPEFAQRPKEQRQTLLDAQEGF